MRNFKSCVRSNPNDAVPNIRSTPEVLSYVKDLEHEVRVLNGYMKRAVATVTSYSRDEFFDVYRMMLEKQSILSNIRVLYKTRFLPLVSDIQPATILSRLDKVEWSIEDSLRDNLTMLSSTEKIPTKVNGLLHTVLQSLKYEAASLFVLPEEKHPFYTARLKNLKLQNGSVYQDFYVSVRKGDSGWVATCSHSLPAVIPEYLEYKSFSTVKSGVNTLHQTLQDEGVEITNKSFNLTPRGENHASTN